MGSSYAEILAELLDWYVDIKFWFTKRKRRKFEKDNNLPKKLMVSPSDKMVLILLALGFVSITIFFFIFYPNMNGNRTKEQLIEIVEILETEKKVLGVYPNRLTDIIRNNPLREGITKDAWNNEIQYALINEGENYLLFSSGKDGIPNTEDDIFYNK